MTADLHIHTTASDGRLSPFDILTNATKANLSYIAITDHDTTAGLKKISAITTEGLVVIPGVEFSTDYPEYEIHILGYNIDINNAHLNKALDTLLADRQNRAKRMLAKLEKLGFSVEYSQVLHVAQHAAAIGRPHIARALVDTGYFASVAEVFEKLIGRDGPAYEPHYKLTVPEVIELIKTSGGTAVLAHPGLTKNAAAIQWVLEQGIDGIEVYHPMHTPQDEHAFLKLAQKRGLLITGGSDYHAIPGRYPEVLGEFTVSADLARVLAEVQA